MEKLDWDSTLKNLITESADRLLPLIGKSDHIQRWLNVELPKTQNLRIDLLAKLTSGKLIHFELQSSNGPQIAFRMLQYAVAIYRREGQFPLQILIYAGNKRVRMPSFLHGPSFDFRFEIIDLKTLDGTPLLESEHLSDNLIALLMSLEDRVAAIQRIIARVIRMDVNKRVEAITRLLLTCGMRGIAEVAREEIKKMSFTFNIATDSLLGPPYRKALADARAEARIGVLRRLLRQKFGPLPKWAGERLASCTTKQMDSIERKLLTASSLEQLFPSSKS